MTEPRTLDDAERAAAIASARVGMAGRWDEGDPCVGDPEAFAWTFERLPADLFANARLLAAAHDAAVRDAERGGDGARAAELRSMADDGVREPVVCAVASGIAWAYDGRARVAACARRGVPVPAYVARPPARARAAGPRGEA